MKRIAVLTYDITVEYSLEVLNGISEYFKDKDIQLVIGQVKEPHCKLGLFEYQCWAATSYLFSEQIDAVIVIYGSFSSTLSPDGLSKLLSAFPSKPTFSVGAELDLPECYSTHTEIANVYTKVVKHLTELHHCKKIGFMSANATNSSEALERYEAYKTALKNNNIDFDENLVLNGKYTASSAIRAIEEKYKTKKDVPFDAILCANDLMATGCETAFAKLGLKVPQNIKIIGFDDTSHATAAKPKLSTINQMIFYQGYKIAEQAYKKLTKFSKIPRISTIKVIPLYRQSCGCIPLDRNDDVYLNQNLKICTKDNSLKVPSSSTVRTNIPMFNFLPEINNICSLFDLSKASNTLRNYSYILKYLMDIAGISGMAICFFDKPLVLQKEDDFVLPDSMRVSMWVDRINNTQEFEPGIFFDPHEEIFPRDIFKDETGNYILYPIFSAEINYGYIVCRLGKTDFSLYSIFLRILINSIVQAYEYTATIEENEKLFEENQQLMENNNNLSTQSRTDELTKILNRRGFYEYAQKKIDVITELNSSGLVLFGDLDGLKTINDTYGHKMGDEAIKAMALAFSMTFRANDVIGRLSGDEFAAVVVGMDESQVPKIKERVNELCVEISAKQNLPFVVSCSIGFVEFNSQKNQLQELLSAADKTLYEEKRIKHEKKHFFHQ
ncbi:MAG: GGDEF domain-containing protein [Treponema sp.]|nr:GGDEF domain-containing protein [Treponema sp.]